jgi:hypothetical protein
MKPIFILTLLFSQTASSNVRPCNQLIYDQIYKNIIQRAIASELTEEDIKAKNTTIETLRELCRGQFSTFERPTSQEVDNE